jgi:hypothetical protein
VLVPGRAPELEAMEQDGQRYFGLEQGPTRRVEAATGEVIVDDELLLIGVLERPEPDEVGAMGGVARGGLRPLGAQDSSSSRKSSRRLRPAVLRTRGAQGTGRRRPT